MPNEVLIVDPDRAALALMAATLRGAGYAPTMAENFEDARALLRVQHFPFMVTAHHLGPHNGLHLILRARADSIHVSTVVSSRKADTVLDHEAYALGAVTVVAPWDRPADLLAALERAKTIQLT